MRFKLHYAWWTHLPAMACIAINIGLLLYTKLPARVPLDFENGLIGRWGSPLELWISMLGWPLLILIGSAVLDEYYARHEQVRRFAWASLVDELLIGLLVGRNVQMIPQLSNPEPVLEGWWPVALVFACVAVALAAFLELRRPYVLSVNKPVDVGALAKDIQPQFQPGGRWVYWEKQNPIWWRCLFVLLTVFFVGAAVNFAKTSDYGGVAFFAFLAMFFMSGYGGLYVALTPEKLTVRAGIFGLLLLRLKLANVAKVEVVWFSALGDFGGWGCYRYSFSQRAWGLFLSGGRGVIVQTKKGRRFLIGSKSPEKLAAATEAARISATFGPDDVKGFVAAVQGNSANQYAIRSDSDSPRTQSSRSGGLLRKLIGVVIGIMLILPLVAIFLYSPGPPKHTITSEGLTIHDRFYPVTVKATDVDIEHAKVVDVGADPHWRLTSRTDGIGLARYKAGWFRVAGGEKVRMYRTISQHLVLLPPKGPNAPILMEAKQPEAFIQELRRAWQ
jgi:hypothetical protein